jgi:hypothetical protein
MVAIPRNCRDPKAAWALLRHLHLSPEAMQARRYHSNILPALRSAWDHPSLDEGDLLYADQPINSLYADLARQIPTQQVSAHSMLIAQSLSTILAAAQGQLLSDGEADLEQFCRDHLAAAQQQLDRLAEFAEGAP